MMLCANKDREEEIYMLVNLNLDNSGFRILFCEEGEALDLEDIVTEQKHNFVYVLSYRHL